MAASDSKDAPRRNGKLPEQNRPEEFQRFEDVARRLMQVPKSELDAKRNGSKRPARSAPRK